MALTFMLSKGFLLLILLQNALLTSTFTLHAQRTASRLSTRIEATPSNSLESSVPRRSVLLTPLLAPLLLSSPTLAAERPPLSSVLYRILRVREATFQEARLIRTGKFQDVQRANVKLAVKFMVDNYRLADAFVVASSYVAPDQRVQAGNVGQRAVQNLLTIQEYFDSADVQNLKVNALSGKEDLVLRGLDATRSTIDEFLAFFDASEVASVEKVIKEENDLNEKEFDKDIGVIINLKAAQT